MAAFLLLKTKSKLRQNLFIFDGHLVEPATIKQVDKIEELEKNNDGFNWSRTKFETNSCDFDCDHSSLISDFNAWPF